ncbi:MAG: efflux RND transporter permease subunit [Verrucomicrobia bacterium]|nr:efflux RND transporter permease subunit [Verrucomicrobiota bacterium]
MDTLIRWALGHRVLVLMLACLLVAVGVQTTLRMPVDVFPDLTAPTVTVITEAHGMSPIEVEAQVTFPVETALNGASGVRRVRSATAVGLSVVWVEFEWGTDIHVASQTVTEKLNTIASELPAQTERPEIAPQSSLMGEIVFLALSSVKQSPADLRNYAETSIRRRLLSVAGVSQVTVIGGGEKQFQVVLNPALMAGYGISLDQVMAVLENGNENVSAGVINERSMEWLVTGVGRMRSMEDIGATVVLARDGAPLRIRDLGTIRMGEAQRRGEASAMGKPAVILGIQKQPGANTLELTRRLDKVLSDISSQLPDGMTLKTDIFRQADFISVAVRNVQRALLEGVVLVTIVVWLFLGSSRATLITLVAIPLSLLTTVLALKAWGASINTMTLGGMAIAIGALVDDAVIDVENVFRRLRENHLLPLEQRRGFLQVVSDASIEIRSSIVFATLIIGIVFVPVFFLTGVEGRLLQPLGVAYLVALAASLLVAVTVTPVLCYLFLPNARGVRVEHEPRGVRWLKRGYGPILDSALAHPWRYTAPAALALAVSVLLTTQMGRTFLPEFNEGSLTISAVTLPGTSLAESDALGRLVEETLLAFPEVVSVARRTGRAERDEHAQGVEASELDVSISMKNRSRSEFLQALRGACSQVPGVNITLGQPISHRIDHMLSGTRANVVVKIFGANLYQLRTLAEKARQSMESIPGVVDLSVEQQTEVPVLRILFNRDAMARHGLTVKQVARAVEASVQGIKASRIIDGQTGYDLVVRLGESEALHSSTLSDVLVDTPGGAKVTLASLAQIQRDTGPNQILREQVERKIVVQCNTAGRDVTGVVNDIRKIVAPILDSTPGYRVEYAGQFESAADASRTLGLVSLAVLVGIGVILHMAFNSGRDVAIIMLNLPLALMGGVAGVFLQGGSWSVASLIGFITVFGIATRNGIMLISHVRHLQEREGVSDFHAAIRRGALERLVPILVTALAAALALIPLALGGDKPGNEIQHPMALVILFGLLTSMILNMVIVPALYLRFGRPSRPLPDSL